ncbi:hypothetical protein E8L99_08675 [Phreatobacter aquaticus]|uniref:Uncharacterized protein n=1 Tax=Phreatobacter aquaticus TaxID=2570229 RepID=A0A4D7QNW6_9HYPH|nr:hypothetical protein [Phreatobacter aquaticus]QCK85832.1 hypothetical protein E8L99_08675 [Phreatobacter aquaticus]
MRRALRWATLLGLVAWTLIAWLAHGLVDLFGSGAASVGAVPGFAPEPYTFAWIASQLRGAGLSAVFAVWVIGAGWILGLSLLAHLIMRKLNPALPRLQSWGSSISSGPAQVQRSRGALARLLGR